MKDTVFYTPDEAYAYIANALYGRVDISPKEAWERAQHQRVAFYTHSINATVKHTISKLDHLISLDNRIWKIETETLPIHHPEDFSKITTYRKQLLTLI